MADTQTQATGEELEKEIEKLLDQEKFEPPEEFRENALWNDPSVYEENPDIEEIEPGGIQDLNPRAAGGLRLKFRPAARTGPISAGE